MTGIRSAGPAAVVNPKGSGHTVEISLEGKVALVTGAGPNTGSGIALPLADSR